MILGNLSLQEAERYLNQLDSLAAEIEHARQSFRNRLEIYRQAPNPQTEVDLQSSIAYFEKHIRPVIVEQQVTERRFSEPYDTLVVGIDQEWQAYEFRQLFQGLDYLNKVYVIRTKLIKQVPELRLHREMTRSEIYRYSLLYYYLSPHEELRVKSVQFASPGSINLEGLGDVIREVRELFHYIITFQFVKGFFDLYDYFKYQRPITQAERRMRLKELVQQEQSQDRKFANEQLEDYRQFLKKMNEIADLVAQLDKKGLARGSIVEETLMNSMSLLHRLGFEKRKVKIGKLQK
jgi:hypothetical protein